MEQWINRAIRAVHNWFTVSEKTHLKAGRLIIRNGFMTFYRYVNHRYQELAKATAMSRKFNPFRTGEVACIEAMLWVTNTVTTVILGILMAPVLLLRYPLVLVGVIKKPMPVLDLMNAQHAQKEAQRLTKLGRKVGMNN